MRTVAFSGTPGEAKHSSHSTAMAPAIHGARRSLRRRTHIRCTHSKSQIAVSPRVSSSRLPRSGRSVSFTSFARRGEGRCVDVPKSIGELFGASALDGIDVPAGEHRETRFDVVGEGRALGIWREIEHPHVGRRIREGRDRQTEGNRDRRSERGLIRLDANRQHARPHEEEGRAPRRLLPAAMRAHVADAVIARHEHEALGVLLEEGVDEAAQLLIDGAAGLPVRSRRCTVLVPRVIRSGEMDRDEAEAGVDAFQDEGNSVRVRLALVDRSLIGHLVDVAELREPGLAELVDRRVAAVGSPAHPRSTRIAHERAHRGLRVEVAEGRQQIGPAPGDQAAHAGCRQRRLAGDPDAVGAERGEALEPRHRRILGREGGLLSQAIDDHEEERRRRTLLAADARQRVGLGLEQPGLDREATEARDAQEDEQGDRPPGRPGCATGAHPAAAGAGPTKNHARSARAAGTTTQKM